MFSVRRNPNNPLIQPDSEDSWWSIAAYNPSPVKAHGKERLLFRAQSKEAYYHDHNLELSIIGTVTRQKNGRYGDHQVLIAPEHDWEEFGCEDPRVTELEGKHYICYTALGAYPFVPEKIRVAIALSDDLETVQEKHLVTPFNAKAMAIFPERVDGKITAILTVHSDLPPSAMAIAQFDKPEDMWSEAYWKDWYANYADHAIDLRRNDSEHTEVGAPPIKVPGGWLLIYSHIQEYFTDGKIFGIEAVLLDEHDPRKIIASTRFPFMVPEEAYERYGRLPEIIFPSGARLDGEDLEIFYGATDTTACSAKIKLADLLGSLSSDANPVQYAERHPENPILFPIPEHNWEANHVLNPTAVELDGRVQMLYRAVGPENTSVVGLATSEDGVHFDERLPEPIYIPRADFELKAAGPTDNSGCEDARIMHIGDKLYITYTAYNSVAAPQVAISSIGVDEFLAHNWDAWTMPELITPVGIDDKDAAIFPKKINGQHMILHRINGHVCADFTDTLDFTHEKLTRCIQIFGPRRGMWDSRKVGIDGPPIETDRGWLLLYHGITSAGEYCLGAVVLDKDDPAIVLGRSDQPIMTPVLDWEKTGGWIDNVIFSCGQIVRGDTIYFYYGGADHVIGLATLSVSKLLETLLG